MLRERERLDKFGENNRAEIEKLTKTNPELQKIMKDKGFKSVDDFSHQTVEILQKQHLQQ